ncbi:MAG: HAMP domain-containing histidine kinase [Bacteroidia bacterium]|nr:HAMP domain-containing histidine kinase [Bacteroidia bacterium]
MSLALIGIIVIQVQQIMRTIELNQSRFNMSVGDALMQVAEDLEGTELVTRFVKVSRALDIDAPNGSKYDRLGDSIVIALDDEMETPRIRQQKVTIRDSLAIVTERQASFPYDSILPDGGNLSYTFFRADTTKTADDMSVELRGHPRILNIVSTALKDAIPPAIGIENRTSVEQVDSLLNAALVDRGIELNYDFWVQKNENLRTPIQRIDNSSEAELKAEHQIQLFPYSSGNEENILNVSFPNEGMYALKNVWGQMALSVLFVAIIMMCFGIAIQVVFRQKKLSEMKNDFINNMTHELKTPIATISLATDAINNPQVRSMEGGIERYTRIIKEENSRMHRQVERVLLAARLDRKEMELKVVEVDMHEVISTAVRNIELQVKNRGGVLQMDCSADAFRVEGDAVHLSNVIYNLLDNANKYSPETPSIKIKTYNQDNYFIVEVEDKGIGISKQDLQQIFTRFYRVSTGNLHEVKGFGLGLSYVKDITEAHGGEVDVRSVLGKGSIFTLALPLNEKELN